MNQKHTNCRTEDPFIINLLRFFSNLAPGNPHFQCSPHQLKKGTPPLFPAEKAVSASLKGVSFLKKYFFLENDPSSYFIHL
jgi:hypothetical protein